MQRIYSAIFSFILALAFTVNAGIAHALNLYVTGDSVNLRSAPSTSSKVLGKLRYGTAVTHLEEEGEFFKVKTTKGTVGYVSTTYASTEQPPARQRVPEPEKKGYTVWMNTNSGVYHNSSCRWYGNTKYGTYMPSGRAAKEGRACQKCGG